MWDGRGPKFQRKSRDDKKVEWSNYDWKYCFCKEYYNGCFKEYYNGCFTDAFSVPQMYEFNIRLPQYKKSKLSRKNF